MIIENKAITVPGSYRDRWYDPGGTLFVDISNSTNAAFERSYREGTGPRRRPAIIDVTNYTRTLVHHPPVTVTSTRTYNNGYKLVRTGDMEDALSSNGYTAAMLEPKGFDSNLENSALVEALAKLDRRDLDLGTALAEREKTARLLADMAAKSVRTVRAARRGNGREILDIWGLSHHGARGKGVVDSYLSYHYGVKPLMQDIAGAAQLMTRMPSENWIVSAKGGDFSERRAVKGRSELGGVVPRRATVSARWGCRAMVTAKQRPLSREEDLKWALGLDNPLATAWELTPWSFVVDWAFPIGDWLQALNSTRYYDRWLTVVSRYHRQDISYSGDTWVSGDNTEVSHLHQHGPITVFQTDRSVSNERPIVGLPFRDPTSLDHMAKALALMASTFASGGIPRHVRY